MLVGNLVPMLAALLAAPWFLHRLGQERFGVLSLIWVVVGYFSFLDMGLGRAVTVAVAPLRATSRAADAAHERDILGAASTLLGGVGLALVALLALALAAWGLPVRFSSEALRAEATGAAWIMLPAIPPLLLTSVLRGHLEGIGAFAALNRVRTASGVALVAGPLLTAIASPDLAWACAAIVLVRVLTLLALVRLVARELALGSGALLRVLLWGGHRAWRRRLLAFGGWATVSNVVGPVIVYVDRFIVADMLTAGAVALYAVPFDVVSRLPVIVAALCSVLLPEIARVSGHPAIVAPGGAALEAAAAPGAGDPGAARRIVADSTLASLLVVVPLVALAIALTPLGLRVWLGADFARQSAALTRILLVAFGINALAQIPFTALQGSGHARAVAFVHLAEVLPYLALVIWAVGSFGLLGAACSWALRGALDYAALAWLWRRLPARARVPA